MAPKAENTFSPLHIPVLVKSKIVFCHCVQTFMWISGSNLTILWHWKRWFSYLTRIRSFTEELVITSHFQIAIDVKKGLLGIKIGQQMVEKDLLDKNRDSVPICAFWGFYVICHTLHLVLYSSLFLLLSIYIPLYLPLLLHVNINLHS